MILSRQIGGREWRSDRGFTLLEILVAVAVLSIIVLVMAQIFNGVLNRSGIGDKLLSFWYHFAIMF